MTIDTACSSSLVAIHNACKSLQLGESQLAIAGGVNLILYPGTTISFCEAHMLAKDGHCKTFDAAADGYVRGEGCGVVVLKLLSDALRDKDPIVGIIKATHVNQDGASSGLTVPNEAAQVALIQEALVDAHLESQAIDYIEAHGTGTSVGDPIEVSALSTVFNGLKNPLLLGSVKTNIGHLEAAAGIAGILKTLLAFKNEAIPSLINFKRLNPLIKLDSIPAQIPVVLTPWKRSSRPRIVGVSSFGFSGTNAHIIVEEPPLTEFKKNPIDRPMHLLTLSAKTETALKELLTLYQKHLPEEDVADIAFSANTGRSHFNYRVALTAQTKEELLDKLQAGNYLFKRVSEQVPYVTYLFKGQMPANSDWLNVYPSFKEAMERSKGIYEYAFFELLKSGESFQIILLQKGKVMSLLQWLLRQLF